MVISILFALYALIGLAGWIWGTRRIYSTSDDELSIVVLEALLFFGFGWPVTLFQAYAAPIIGRVFTRGIEK